MPPTLGIPVDCLNVPERSIDKVRQGKFRQPPAKLTPQAIDKAVQKALALLNAFDLSGLLIADDARQCAFRASRICSSCMDCFSCSFACMFNSLVE